jgi:hypothetical protein
MGITLAHIRALKLIDKVSIHSLCNSRYQASVWLEGEEHYLVDRQGYPVSHHNSLGWQALFSELPVTRIVLNQRSAYDEMIGLAQTDTDNQLEVPLGKTNMATVPTELLNKLR